MRYGYARVSTEDQDLTIQIEALEKLVDEVRTEKQSGTSLANRSELNMLLEFMRKGDTLVVGRLARSIADLQKIVEILKSKGIALQATEQPINTSSAAEKAFLDMLGVFAEFETNLRRERQMEGIAKAKAAGKYRGRRKTLMKTWSDLSTKGNGSNSHRQRTWNRSRQCLPCIENMNPDAF